MAWQQGRKQDLVPGNPSDNLAEIPPFQGRSAVEYLTDDLRISLEALFATSQDNIDPFVGELEIDGYTVLNLRAQWSATPSLTLAAGLENLLDETYAVHNAVIRNPFSAFAVVNEPGRFLYANVEFRW